MIRIKVFLGMALLLATTNVGFAQTETDSLFSYFRNKSVKSSSDAQKTVYSDSLRLAIKDFLNQPYSFDQPLGEIPYTGDLFSPDGAFRMITWNLSLKDGTYDYICFVQLAPDENGDSEWHELTDNHKQTRRPETKALNKSNWYGALYYTIVPFKKNKQTCYLLLGWEGNSKFSNKKIMDCLNFNTRNEPVFDKTVFKSGRLNKRRVIFEYSKEAYFMLRYNEKLKLVVFNRLEPPKPELKGLYSYYQPTITFDAYKLIKGEWVIVEDVNPRNKKDDRPYIDPSKKKAPKL